MRYTVLLLFPLLLTTITGAQINPDQIDIVRDQWGVPHIFAPTDAGVAYGLAWATAEDDFRTLQEQLLPVRGLMGRVYGKKGAVLDVAVHLIGAREIVETRYEKDLTLPFRRIVEAYAAGVNAYAAAHPQEVLHKNLFPIQGQHVIQGYVLGMALMSNVDKALSKILNGEIITEQEARGSNAFALSRKKTTDDKTYLAINSHQPLEGLNSWYEVHLCSEEGWNALGATFAGGVSIFLGSNPFLGWAHTVNYPDLADIYALQMHPDKKLWYRFDGHWEQLEPYHTRARVKVLGLFTIVVKRKFYKSKYGVTFETPSGFYALRFPANRDIRAAEQWYRMNKATNFEEFQAALRMQAIICTNIVYADREDHVYYLSNGRFPVRDPHYDWADVLPGDTSATLWGDQYYPLDSLAQVLDPASGYVYNCNHTPFLSSGQTDNPAPESVPRTMGYQEVDMLTNRGARFDELIRQYDQLSYEDFKTIKYDLAYQNPMKAYPRLEPIFSLDPLRYPQLATGIQLLRDWDRVADEESEGASVFILAYNYLSETLKEKNSLRRGSELDEAKLVEALSHAQDHLRRHFGRVAVPLGELQRHQRGDIDLPLGGAPDVLAAMYSKPLKNGRIRASAGESYIQLVRFSDEGVEIESIHAYGSSAKEDSPHFTDQMPWFTGRQLKTMTLDREQVFSNAARIYHPGEE